MPRKNPYPGVTRVADRHGKPRFRFRRKGVDCYIHGVYGSPEFIAEYQVACEGTHKAAQPTAKAFTFDWLMQKHFATPRYRGLSATTRDNHRRRFAWISKEIGDLPFAKMKPEHVEALMAKKLVLDDQGNITGGRDAAKRVKVDLNGLYKLAQKNGWVPMGCNPAALADTVSVKTDGYYTWTLADVRQFMEVHGPGTKARLALLIMATTGASRQDVVKMGRQNVKDGRINFARGKTKVATSILVTDELQAEIDMLPAGQMLFVTHRAGQPYTKESFGNWFHNRVREAGLTRGSAHGLRKFLATLAAEQGASTDEIRATMAHSSNAQAETYTKKARINVLTDNVQRKISGTKLSNH